jgi:mono/diheme cytochrome c family protein
MEQRTNSPYAKRDRPVLGVIGVLLVVAAVLFTRNDREHEWRYYQFAFKQIVGEKLGADRVKTVPTGLQQIWVPSLGRADRCITCHQATIWKGFEAAAEPFKTHPAVPLKNHPIEKFGCTSCHGGQGWAVDVGPAHGPVEHWEEPLLGRELGTAYSLVDNKAALMQMNCNTCHRYDRETQGAEMINLAKRVLKDKGCRACHAIDKAPEQYDYGRLSGQKTSFAWHVAHLKDPRALVTDTVMPNFNLTTKEAQAVAILILSWRKSPVPAAMVPGTPRTDPQSAEEKVAEDAMKTGPGAWFVKTGCFVCHSISALGVKSPAQIGPDLSNAVEDVQSRFGRTIDDFLAAPTGTMSVVLSRQIILSPAEKTVAIEKLRDAFKEYQRQKTAGKSPISSGNH